jgi:membrane protein implicated in regulation of membrane protease activity
MAVLWFLIRAALVAAVAFLTHLQGETVLAAILAVLWLIWEIRRVEERQLEEERHYIGKGD